MLQAVLGPLMSDEQNDYSEIFTPTDPRDGWPEAEQMNSAMSGISGIAVVSWFLVLIERELYEILCMLRY
jgi:hypothetical protein